MKIVITGGGGFVGRYLQEELQAHDVTSWDLPEVDITKPETYQTLLQNTQPDWLVHLAALASVQDSFNKADEYLRVNAEGTRTLLEVIKQHSPHTKVLAVSTADIYGFGDDQPMAELPLAQAQPKNPYAASKVAMEKIIEEHFNDMCIRVRPFPHIGPGQKKGFVTADFASQVAAIEKNEQAPVLRVGNLEAQRDFTDVRDVVRAYQLLIEKGQLGEVYHVASGKPTAIQTILDTLLELSTVNITVEQDPERMRPSDVPLMVGDATKINQATSWEPQVNLKQSLEEILNYWRNL